MREEKTQTCTHTHIFATDRNPYRMINVQNTDTSWSCSLALAYTSSIKPLHLRPREHFRKGGRTSICAGGQEINFETFSPGDDRETIFMIQKQYGCLNNKWTMTISGVLCHCEWGKYQQTSAF